jgi:hypothetical protein
MTIILRWLARIIGLLASAFFLMFAIGEAAPLPLLILIALASLGVIIALRWERIGGTVATIVAIALGLYVFQSLERAPTTVVLVYSLPFLVAASSHCKSGLIFCARLALKWHSSNRNGTRRCLCVPNLRWNRAFRRLSFPCRKPAEASNS